MNKNHKLVIIIIGPPGAGKGTQAELLSEKLSMYYFETSRILEESWKNTNKKDNYIEVEGKKYFLIDEKELFDNGKLCSPPFVTYMVKKKIKKLADQDKGIVMAGSPRTVYEGKNIMPFIKELYETNNILVLELKVGDKEAIWRNTRRRICSKCRQPVPYTPETKDLEKCPKCGGKLVTRTLDTEQTMKTRLKEYKQRTYPLFEYFKEIGIAILEINGQQAIKEVQTDMLNTIERWLESTKKKK